MNFQKIIIAGNATKKPERRTSKKGDVDFTTMSVAVRDRREKSVYFPITIFGKQGEITAKYIKRGDGVLIEGRIDTDPETGRFNVVADRVVFGAKTGPKGKDKARATAAKIAADTDEE